MADLKLVYKAPTEEVARKKLEEFEEKWGKKYPVCVESWKRNWAELSTYFKYPSEIRKAFIWLWQMPLANGHLG